MLEEKDLTSEQRVRLEFVDIATRTTDIGMPASVIIEKSKELGEYIMNGDKTDG